MVSLCAECGCEFEGGVRRSLCESSPCCCTTASEETNESVAARFIDAYESANLSAIRELLAPTATWGAPGQAPATCRTRDQIMKWYEAGYAQGTRATVEEVLLVDDHVVLGLRITELNGEASGPVERWQVLTIGNAQISDIRGYESRDGALLAATSLEDGS